jgi:hypothetical protein
MWRGKGPYPLPRQPLAEYSISSNREIEMLTAIKLLHMLIWAFLAASIVALPVVGVSRRFRWAAILSCTNLLAVDRSLDSPLGRYPTLPGIYAHVQPHISGNRPGFAPQ